MAFAWRTALVSWETGSIEDGIGRVLDNQQSAKWELNAFGSSHPDSAPASLSLHTLLFLTHT
jgi:hypothetical protein